MTTPGSESPEHVSMRSIWPNETIDFTPWLAKNLPLLGHAIDLELQFVEREKFGYGGYTDIFAKTPGGSQVVIENQMEPSDNDHFVRLIGYAADHNADVLIWVAPRFEEYHQRMLGWLQQAMADGKTVHAVEVRLTPDGDLRPVDANPDDPGFSAVFSKVALRNDWPTGSLADLSEINRRYLDFFQPMIGELRRAGMTDREHVLAGNNQSFPSGFTGIGYNVGFWGGIVKPSLDVYLWIAAGETDRNKEIFDRLTQYRAKIDGKLTGVTWDPRDGQRMCCIYFSESGSIADPEANLAELRTWAVDRLVQLKTAFQPHLEQVMPDLQTHGND